MPFLSGTKAQVRALRKALAEADGLPVRGVTVGGPDCVPQEPGPGWTEWNTPEPEEDGDDAALEVPAEVAPKLSAAQRALLRNTPELPARLRAKVEARRAPEGLPSGGGDRNPL